MSFLTRFVIYNNAVFSDISTHWAKDAISDMTSRLILPGASENEFKPDSEMTRAEFICTIVTALGLPASEGQGLYGDVEETDSYNGYIRTAVEYSLITGYDSTHFGPDDPITREQAMTVIVRAMNLAGMDVDITNLRVAMLLAKYNDRSDVSDYAKENIAVCIRAGIINGISSDMLSPKSFTTRAEAAVMIQRLLKGAALIN